MAVINGIAIAGLGETGYYKRGAAPMGETGLTLQAIIRAAEDAGIDPRDIDGFASYAHDKNDATKLAPALGTRELRWASLVHGGGGGGVAAAVGHAAAAVVSGQARYVVVTRTLAEAENGQLGVAVSREHMSAHYRAHGIVAPAQLVALRTRRLLDEFGIPERVLMAISQVAYRHANSNPRAVGRDIKLDEETYLSSRWIAEPYRLYDCSRENDASVALIVSSVEDAVKPDRPTPHVVAVEEGGPYRWGQLTENDDAYSTAGYATLASRLWEATGLTAADIDVTQVYENFSGAAVASLIDFGFCTPENAAELLTLENLSAPTGAMPINTGGGMLAEGFVHGVGTLAEAVRQIRGESPNQVPDVRHSLVIGGPYAPLQSTVLFSSKPLTR